MLGYVGEKRRETLKKYLPNEHHIIKIRLYDQ